MAFEDKKITSRRVISTGLFFAASETVDILANTDDLVVPNLENTVEIRLNPDGNHYLTGLTPFDDTLAQWIVIFNVGTGNLNFKNNDAGSVANARFLMGANKTVQPNEGMTFLYDDVDKRWRSFAINI